MSRVSASQFATELERAGCVIEWDDQAPYPATEFTAKTGCRRGRPHDSRCRHVRVVFYADGGLTAGYDSSERLRSLTEIRRRLGVLVGRRGLSR